MIHEEFSVVNSLRKVVKVNGFLSTSTKRMTELEVSFGMQRTSIRLLPILLRKRLAKYKITTKM